MRDLGIIKMACVYGLEEKKKKREEKRRARQVFKFSC